jgi:4-deoxy-L-threo-5-hexosulose-uronate ketol-isomerase
MSMDVYHGAAPSDVARYDTEQLRSAFLIESLFRPAKLKFIYCHMDRMITGGACPVGSPLTFGDGDELGTQYFFSAREMGIANLGGAGKISVDGKSFDLANRDILYVGRGAREVVLTSDNPDKPAWFYMNSVPAGADIAHRCITRAEAKPVDLGDALHANKRRLAMYIHPEVAPSCLLLMGITDLAPASIWNTMPPHLHERRMEAYLYFDMSDEDRVIHLMGQPEATRHLIVGNGNCVLSPSWSIHMGAGTGPYAFVWGMTGENQAYNDFDPVPVARLR